MLTIIPLTYFILYQERQRAITGIKMQIKCIGRRIVEIKKIDDNISLVIHWKDRIIATLQFEKEEALKLVGELNGLIRFDPSTK